MNIAYYRDKFYEYIDKEADYTKASKISLKSRFDQQKGAFNFQPFMQSLNIINWDEFFEDDARKIKVAIEQAYPKPKQVYTRNNQKSLAMVFIDFLMNKGYMKRNQAIIECFNQEKHPDKLPKIFTVEQKDALANAEFSPKNEFSELRNRLIVLFFEFLKGLRNAIEISNLKMRHFDKIEEGLFEAYSKRENRFLRIPEEWLPIVLKYLQLRLKQLQKHPEFGETDSFFIKEHPNMGRKSAHPTWDLNKPGISEIYSRLQIRYPVLLGTIPYTNRHTRATEKKLLGIILNIPSDLIAKSLGQSLIVQDKVYNYYADFCNELLDAGFDGIIPKLKDLEEYCQYRISQEPERREYRYALTECQNKIGEAMFQKVLVGMHRGLSKYFRSDSDKDSFREYIERKTLKYPIIKSTGQVFSSTTCVMVEKFMRCCNESTILAEKAA
jgi:site-specific recombinase XerD